MLDLPVHGGLFLTILDKAPNMAIFGLLKLAFGLLGVSDMVTFSG
jgi:hypothetical protein